MSKSNDNIYASCIKWIRFVCDIPAIRARATPAAKRPSGQYATIHVTTTETHSEQKYSDDGDDLGNCVMRRSSHKISINIYRSNAMDAGETLAASLVSDVAVDPFFPSAGVLQLSDVRDLSTAIKSEYEDRAQFDMQVNECKSIRIGSIGKLDNSILVCAEIGTGKLDQYNEI